MFQIRDILRDAQRPGKRSISHEHFDGDQYNFFYVFCVFFMYLFMYFLSIFMYFYTRSIRTNSTRVTMYNHSGFTFNLSGLEYFLSFSIFLLSNNESLCLHLEEPKSHPPFLPICYFNSQPKCGHQMQIWPQIRREGMEGGGRRGSGGGGRGETEDTNRGESLRRERYVLSSPSSLCSAIQYIRVYENAF